MLEDLQGRKVVPVISNMPRFKFSYASGDINLTTKSPKKRKIWKLFLYLMNLGLQNTAYFSCNSTMVNINFIIIIF